MDRLRAHMVARFKSNFPIRALAVIAIVLALILVSHTGVQSQPAPSTPPTVWALVLTIGPGDARLDSARATTGTPTRFDRSSRKRAAQTGVTQVFEAMLTDVTGKVLSRTLFEVDPRVTFETDDVSGIRTEQIFVVNLGVPYSANAKWLAVSSLTPSNDDVSLWPGQLRGKLLEVK